MYNDRYTTEVGTDVNKTYTHILFYSTYLYHVYMSEDINLLQQHILRYISVRRLFIVGAKYYQLMHVHIHFEANKFYPQ